MPVFEYGHGQGRCSVTGGYVYRGRNLSALRGAIYSGTTAAEKFLLSLLGVALPQAVSLASFAKAE